jgi:MoaA/NifB/PqqE/SkfB family radical SAM enzyme
MTNCINVYKGLRYTNSGEVMFCCKSENWLDDKDGNRCKIDTHTFDEALNGKQATEIRDALEKGIKHKNCQKCWDEEASGIASKRMLDNDRAQRYWGLDYLRDTTVQAEIVELNLGTVCNLKCRICGPWSSSKWVKEHYAVLAKGEPFDKYMERIYQWQGNWEEDSPAWENIENNLPNLKQIDFYGGEPFLVDKNWEILQKSVDEGYAKDQILHFNTNATTYKEEHIETLKKFKSVLISLSIDDIGERFEFQRHPAKWDVVSENLQKFIELNKSNPQIDLLVCVTVNNLNVYYMTEIMHYFEKQKVQYYANYLHFPAYYNIRNMKQELKSKVADKYARTRTGLTTYSLENLKRITTYMENHISTQGPWEEFLNITKAKDDYRKESFADTFPEWSKIIEEN